MSDPHWIEHMHMKKGALHREMHVPVGKNLSVKGLRHAEHKGGKMGHRAQVALTLRKLHG